MISGLFDDHYQAFPLWREAGLKGLTCIHVDAHLDVSSDGFDADSLQGIARARTRSDLEQFRGNPGLPWGGFHCGNYLYPALVDGTVTTLIWVVPSGLVDPESMLASARQTLQSWVDLTLEEYSLFRAKPGRVEGVLLGRRFVICICDQMPDLSAEEASNIALDVDVDYFIRLKDDTIWQTPHELARILGPMNPLALTVAISCGGGYTPPFYRFLGKICLDVFSGQTQAWEQELSDFHAAYHRQPGEGESAEQARSQALEALLEKAPEFMQPAVLTALGRTEQAQALDSEYAPSLLDDACRHFQKHEFDKGFACLDASGDETEARSYLTVFMAAGDQKFELSLSEVRALLERPGIAPRDEARLLVMCAELVSRQGRTKKAVELLKRSLKAEPDRAATHHQLALNLRQLGDRSSAARHLRKALRLAKNRVSSLAMMLDAARLYDEMGQKALARATRRELKEADVTGFYAISSILDQAR